jgi:hypothetical protein
MSISIYQKINGIPMGIRIRTFGDATSGTLSGTAVRGSGAIR